MQQVALAILLMSLPIAVSDPQESKPRPPASPPSSPSLIDPVQQDGAKDVVVDADLGAVMDALERADSYRFLLNGKADLSRLGTNPPAPDPKEKVALAKDRLEKFEIHGSFQRDKPLLLMTDQIQAFRKGDKVAHRTKSRSEWSVLSRLPGAKTTPPATTGDELRLLPFLGRIQAPHELLKELRPRILTCRKSTVSDAGESGAPKDSSKDPTRASWTCTIDDRDDRAKGTAAPATSSTLVVTVAQGRVERIVREIHSSNGDGDSLHDYKVMEIGNVEVTIPEEAAPLLVD